MIENYFPPPRDGKFFPKECRMNCKGWTIDFMLNMGKSFELLSQPSRLYVQVSTSQFHHLISSRRIPYPLECKKKLIQLQSKNVNEKIQPHLEQNPIRKTLFQSLSCCSKIIKVDVKLIFQSLLFIFMKLLIGNHKLN